MTDGLFAPFFYDTVSHRGVSLYRDAVTIVMKPDFDPYRCSEPGTIKEYEIDPCAFEDLFQAGNRIDRKAAVDVLRTAGIQVSQVRTSSSR